MSWSRVTSDIHHQDSITGIEEYDPPPPEFCRLYIIALIFLYMPTCILCIAFSLPNTSRCYLELMADSITVSGNISTGANWTVSLATRSPSTICDLSLYTINGSLLYGDKVIAKSTTLYSYKQFVSQVPVTTMRFTTAKIDGVGGEEALVWDVGVEILASVKADDEKRKGFLNVTCRDLPVRLWSYPGGNVKGYLLGGMRRCDYLFREELEHCLNKWLPESSCPKHRMDEGRLSGW